MSEDKPKKLVRKPAKKAAKKAVEQEPRLEQEPVEERLEAPVQELPKDEVVNDYLRQYQVRKGTKYGSIESDPRQTKAIAMKKHLLAQPKIRMFVPRSESESETIKQSVTLNGYRLDFPKQTYVDVPQQISELLLKSLDQKERALLQSQISGNADKESALL